METIVPVPINPLSAPRGVRLVDELTGKPAALEINLGGVHFYYATKQSFYLDWEGVLCALAPMYAELAASGGVVGTQSERAVQNARNLEIQNMMTVICDHAAQHHLVRKRFELAIPAGLRGLRLLISLHGDSSVKLIPTYLQLAEANLGLGRHIQADDFLSKCNWVVLRCPSTPNRLRGRLHRNYGRLFAFQGDSAAAVAAFAKDVFFTSLAVGPESVDVCAALFLMEQVFQAQGRLEAALAMADKVVDIYYKHLLSATSAIAAALGLDFSKAPPEQLLRLKGHTPPEQQQFRGAAEAAVALPPASYPQAAALLQRDDRLARGCRLSEEQAVEALEMLAAIAGIREGQLGAGHVATGEAKFTWALVHLDGGDASAAAALLREALGVFTQQLGAEHPSSLEASRLLAAMAVEGHVVEEPQQQGQEPAADAIAPALAVSSQ